MMPQTCPRYAPDDATDMRLNMPETYMLQTCHRMLCGSVLSNTIFNHVKGKIEPGIEGRMVKLDKAF